jgi:hypothetical protein
MKDYLRSFCDILTARGDTNQLLFRLSCRLVSGQGGIIRTQKEESKEAYDAEDVCHRDSRQEGVIYA